jgi:hypothetical protein
LEILVSAAPLPGVDARRRAHATIPTTPTACATAVGSALASSAIATATSIVPTETTTHPNTSPNRPPRSSPCAYVAKIPVRTLMTEKLSAKLEKPPIDRRSSCA